MLLNYRLRNIYSDEAIDFHSQKIPKLGSNYVCLIVIVIDYVLQKDGSFYLQMFLKKNKNIEKEHKVVMHITDELKNSYDNSGQLNKE